VEREQHAAHQRQPVGQALRQGQAVPGPVQHQQGAAQAHRHAGDGARVDGFMQQRARKQHRPDRHQVEQQDHPHHIADRDCGVETGVVETGRDHQRPQGRRADQFSEGARHQHRQQHEGRAVKDGGRPKRVHARAVEAAKRDP